MKSPIKIFTSYPTEESAQSPPAVYNQLASPSVPSIYVTNIGGNVQELMIGDINIYRPLQDRKEVANDQTCDVLLVTVTECESRAVLDLCQKELQQDYDRHFIGNKTYYDLGLIGGAKIFLVQSEMGAGGAGGAILTVQEAITALSPLAVILVGVAFGIKEGRKKSGRVLVSRQIMEYDVQRVGTDEQGRMKMIPQGDRAHASVRLLDRFRSGALDWRGAPIEFGLLLSGSKLIENREYWKQLQLLEPEAIGGETEGAGLYAAALLNKVDWIVVKAVCDWTSGRKTANKKTQYQKAAYNAASFTLHIIKQGGLARER